jgi:hypothetical protein
MVHIIPSVTIKLTHTQDLNGDGRADYLWVHTNGSVEAWLNMGGPDNDTNAAKVGWQYNGLVAGGIGAPGSSVMFADLNGDRRAEYLSVGLDGNVTAYLNLGTSDNNGPEAAKVNWLTQGTIVPPGFMPGEPSVDLRGKIVFAGRSG